MYRADTLKDVENTEITNPSCTQVKEKEMLRSGIYEPNAMITAYQAYFATV